MEHEEELETLCGNFTNPHKNCSFGEEEDARDGPEAVVIPFVFVLIFGFGLFWNGILLYYLCAKKKFKSPHAIYICNLVVGDFVMLTVAMPFVSTLYTLPDWPYGEFVCKLSEFSKTLCTSVTILTLTALSVERFVLIMSPYLYNRRQLGLIVVVVIWSVSVCLALPDIVSSRIHQLGDYQFCVLYPSAWGNVYSRVHVIMKFLLLFVCPLLVIATFYVLIAVKVTFRARKASLEKSTQTSREQTHLTSPDGINADSMDNTSLAKRKKVAAVVLGLVFVFIFCWIPHYVFLFWFHFDMGWYNMFWHVLKIVGFCLIFTNSACNPIVYFVLDKKFQYFVSSTLCCRRHRGVNVESEMTSTCGKQTVNMTTFTHHAADSEVV